MGGGLKWSPIRGRPNIDDRRQEGPAVREHADAVDGRRMTDEPDKQRKAHGEEVDTSNGALFLRIMELERTVAYLMCQVDLLREHSRDYDAHNIRIG